MNGLDKAMPLLPPGFRQALEVLPAGQVEEIRMRSGRNPTVLLAGEERELLKQSIMEEDILRLLEKATGASLHSAAPALAEGFLNYRGIRIGVCGTAVIRNECLAGFRFFSSVAIRIPRECRGICKEILPALCGGGFQNTLILAPPGGGKTTALRELIRCLSERKFRIGVVDERNELAAADRGQAQFDLGEHSDVLTGVDKQRGCMMLLRGMNPQILAMDEISREQDLETAMNVVGCGVKLLASAHATNVEELSSRPLYQKLLDRQIFKRFIIIGGNGDRRYYRILEAQK